MSIVWNLRTGHFNDVEESLRRSVGQYMRHASHNHIKVGITSNPDRRWREHYKSEWDKMAVLYETTSLNYAKNSERSIVEHFGISRANCETWNIHAGGNGRFSPENYYYTYVVLCE